MWHFVWSKWTKFKCNIVVFVAVCVHIVLHDFETIVIRFSHTCSTNVDFMCRIQIICCYIYLLFFPYYYLLFLWERETITVHSRKKSGGSKSNIEHTDNMSVTLSQSYSQQQCKIKITAYCTCMHSQPIALDVLCLSAKLKKYKWIYPHTLMRLLHMKIKSETSQSARQNLPFELISVLQPTHTHTHSIQVSWKQKHNTHVARNMPRNIARNTISDIEEVKHKSIYKQ